MSNNAKNTSASVHQRLLNKARETGQPFNEILQHFAIERFIYRLSKSSHADKFFLKGALMLSTWTGTNSRPTMDIDLLGKVHNHLDVIAAIMKDTCLVEVADDGLDFEPVFTSSFLKDKGKQIQWVGFINKAKLTNAPRVFEAAATAVRVFLEPVIASLVDQKPFHSDWIAPGPWR